MMQTTVPATTTLHEGVADGIGSLRVLGAVAAKIGNWATAAEGRRRTEAVLRALDRASWQVAHRVVLPHGGGHVEHVAVGPGGVFVLDSKAWRGLVTVDHKGATITPEDDPRAAWTAHGEHRSLPPVAATVVHALAAATGSALPAPCAVVVVWAPFPDRVAVSGGVTYVAGDHLLSWLSGRPPRLDREQLAGLAGVLSSDLALARYP